MVIWRNYATSTQFRFIHESIVHQLQEHGVNKVLGDDTALPTIHADKPPEAHFGRVPVSNVQASLPDGLLTQSFDTHEEARAWLCGNAR
jgi:hypothetical protein